MCRLKTAVHGAPLRERQLVQIVFQKPRRRTGCVPCRILLPEAQLWRWRLGSIGDFRQRASALQVRVRASECLSGQWTRARQTYSLDGTRIITVRSRRVRVLGENETPTTILVSRHAVLTQASSASAENVPQTMHSHCDWVGIAIANAARRHLPPTRRSSRHVGEVWQLCGVTM